MAGAFRWLLAHLQPQESPTVKWPKKNVALNTAKRIVRNRPCATHDGCQKHCNSSNDGLREMWQLWECEKQWVRYVKALNQRWRRTRFTEKEEVTKSFYSQSAFMYEIGDREEGGPFLVNGIEVHPPGCSHHLAWGTPQCRALHHKWNNIEQSTRRQSTSQTAHGCSAPRFGEHQLPTPVKKRRAQICSQIQRFIKIPTELRRQTRTSTTHTKHKRSACSRKPN